MKTLSQEIDELGKVVFDLADKLSSLLRLKKIVSWLSDKLGITCKPVIVMGKCQPFSGLDELVAINNAVLATTPIKRHTTAADTQAFDDLYEALQEIATINERALRDGQKGYKSGHMKIREICQKVT